MIVVKFGGSSVGTAESIKVVGDVLIEKSGKHDCFVVVSAVGGVTNKLIEMAQCAEKGVSDYEIFLREIEEIHLALVKALISVKLQSSVLGGIKLIINELEEVLKGIFVLKENSSKSFDFVCGIGERLSSLIIFKYLNSLSQDVNLVDPTKIIICTNEFGTGKILIEKSREKDAEHRKLREFDSIAKKLDASKSINILLDEKGKLISTIKLKSMLHGYQLSSERNLNFIIGGPDGTCNNMKQAVHENISLSMMTLPHLLARILLLEQIYRALSILINHPYHK